MKEFVAFSRKLLRILRNIEKALQENDTKKALEILEGLIEDTERDIEA